MYRLYVPYAEKEQAKSRGARWNHEQKYWFAPNSETLARCYQWAVETSISAAKAKSAQKAYEKPGRVKVVKSSRLTPSQLGNMSSDSDKDQISTETTVEAYRRFMDARDRTAGLDSALSGVQEKPRKANQTHTQKQTKQKKNKVAQNKNQRSYTTIVGKNYTPYSCVCGQPPWDCTCFAAREPERFREMRV